VDENVNNTKAKVIDQMKDSKGLMREAEVAKKNQKVKNDIDRLLQRLVTGDQNPGIGTRRLQGVDYVLEARAKSGARVYYRKKGDDIVLLAISNKV